MLRHGKVKPGLLGLGILSNDEILLERQILSYLVYKTCSVQGHLLADKHIWLPVFIILIQKACYLVSLCKQQCISGLTLAIMACDFLVAWRTDASTPFNHNSNHITPQQSTQKATI